MRLRLTRHAGAVLAVGIIGLLTWRLLHHPQPTTTAASSPPVASPDGSVTLAPSQQQALGIALGKVETATSVPLPGLLAETQAPLGASQQVASPWAGTVTAVLIAEGQHVQAGQPVVRLRSVEALRAGADLAQARSEADLARQQASRDAQLLAEGIIPAARYQQTQAQARRAEAELARARESLAGARVRLADGEVELLAPISGQVLRRLVRPGDGLMPQQPALLIADPDRLDIAFGVPAMHRAQIRPGLRVTLADGSQAEVVAVAADLDPASQQLPIRARLQSPGAHLAGERLEVTLHLPPPPGALLLPRAALLPDGDGYLAYLHRDGRFRAVKVTHVLGSTGETAVVLAPALTPGAEVVIRGTVALKAILPSPTHPDSR